MFIAIYLSFSKEKFSLIKITTNIFVIVCLLIIKLYLDSALRRYHLVKQKGIERGEGVPAQHFILHSSTAFHWHLFFFALGRGVFSSHLDQ